MILQTGLVALAALLLSLPASARMGQSPRQVSGEVIHLKLVEVRGTDSRNVVALLRTQRGDRRVVVDLGPQVSVGDRVQLGSKIDVVGKINQIRDRRFLVAQKLRVNGQVTNIERSAQRSQAQAGAKDSESRTFVGTVALVQFSEGSARLNADAKKALREAFRQARQSGQRIREVQIATFADGLEAPTGAGGAQVRRLVERRSAEVRDYLMNRLQVNNVRIHNMADEENRQALRRQSQESELHSESARKGTQSASSYDDSIDAFREYGAPSAAVVYIRTY